MAAVQQKRYQNFAQLNKGQQLAFDAIDESI